MQFFLSNHVNIAFIDCPAASQQGGKTPVLLIHGFASTHQVNWVNTGWIKVLTEAGHRVIAFDNRGHGVSEKLYQPDLYHPDIMADDARNLLDYLNIEQAHIMGYSMGARICAHLAVSHPARVKTLLMGGLGIHLIEGQGLPLGIADALELPSRDTLTDPMQLMFRTFAEQNRGDLKALAACIRGSRHNLSKEQLAKLAMPSLISIGTRDAVAGSAQELASFIPRAQVLNIPGRDHNLAVGDRVHKEGVLAFLQNM